MRSLCGYSVRARSMDCCSGRIGDGSVGDVSGGFRAPSILGRIKTQAVDKNVFVRVEVLPEDLDELESQLMPNSGSSQSSDAETAVNGNGSTYWSKGS